MAALWGKKKKRACVIGLDGVPYTLVRRFTEDGTMPALAEIVRAGHLSKMRVTSSRIRTACVSRISVTCALPPSGISWAG